MIDSEVLVLNWTESKDKLMKRINIHNTMETLPHSDRVSTLSCRHLWCQQAQLDGLAPQDRVSVLSAMTNQSKLHLLKQLQHKNPVYLTSQIKTQANTSHVPPCEMLFALGLVPW